MTNLVCTIIVDLLPFTKQKRVKMETSGKQKCAVYQAFLLENLLEEYVCCILLFIFYLLGSLVDKLVANKIAK